jgi:hypothetical protein
MTGHGKEKRGEGGAREEKEREGREREKLGGTRGKKNYPAKFGEVVSKFKEEPETPIRRKISGSGAIAIQKISFVPLCTALKY